MLEIMRYYSMVAELYAQQIGNNEKVDWDMMEVFIDGLLFVVDQIYLFVDVFLKEVPGFDSSINSTR